MEFCTPLDERAKSWTMILNGCQHNGQNLSTTLSNWLLWHIVPSFLAASRTLWREWSCGGLQCPCSDLWTISQHPPHSAGTSRVLVCATQRAILQLHSCLVSALSDYCYLDRLRKLNHVKANHSRAGKAKSGKPFLLCWKHTPNNGIILHTIISGILMTVVTFRLKLDR